MVVKTKGWRSLQNNLQTNLQAKKVGQAALSLLLSIGTLSHGLVAFAAYDPLDPNNPYLSKSERRQLQAAQNKVKQAQQQRVAQAKTSATLKATATAAKAEPKPAPAQASAKQSPSPEAASVEQAPTEQAPLQKAKTATKAAPVEAPAESNTKPEPISETSAQQPTEAKPTLQQTQPQAPKTVTPKLFALQAQPSTLSTSKASSLAQNLAVQAGIQQAPGHLSLVVGKSEILDLDFPAARVSISDPNVASALVISPRQLQLIGNQTGVTSLTVWPSETGTHYERFDLSVRRDVSLLQSQLRQVAPEVNVAPLIARDTVILTGEANSLEESQLAVQLARAFFGMNLGGMGAAGGNAAPANAGSAAGTGSGAGQAGGGMQGGMGGGMLASSAAGSSAIGASQDVINLIHVKGMPRTKVALVQEKLTRLNANINLDVVPGQNGLEKAILTGTVPTSGIVSKAINLASVFYGEPGIKVLTGPGGNGVRDVGSEDFHSAEAFSDNMDVNLQQGVVMTDTTGNVVSLMEVENKPLIRCHIKVLDVSRNATDQMGVPFLDINPNSSGIVVQNDFTPSGAPAATGQGLAGLVGATLGFRSSDLNVTLQALEQKQLVRSLAEPTLLTMSGEKASFLAGGEVPIPVSDANGRITLEYREFGIRVNLIATLTDQEKIHLQVAPEVSSIDPSLSFESQFLTIPGIRSRRMQTTVEMLPGQSFILGGLFNTEDTEALSKFPYLSNIPVIGRFLSSNLKDKTDNELIIVIQPEILTNNGLASAN